MIPNIDKNMEPTREIKTSIRGIAAAKITEKAKTNN